MQRLPEDVLADILGGLPPRSLAAARCVCRAWQATIDDRRLLGRIRDLLPLSLAGIFINFDALELTDFFFRPSTNPAIGADLHSITLPTDDIRVEDVCNGLVLLYSFVVNPATRRWASLPPCPPFPMGTGMVGFEDFYDQNYILFDPMVSPHCYQVLRFLLAPRSSHFDPPKAQQEWPPSVFPMHVFSSETTTWEEKSFIRQGDARTLADMLLGFDASHQPHAVYWHGHLYLHYSSFFIIRLSLSACTYQVFKLPVHVDAKRYTQSLLGRSEKGVYFAALGRDQCRLQVWILDEFNEWRLKHDNNLHHNIQRGIHRPWILADVNHNFYQDTTSPLSNLQVPVQDKLEEWYSDNEDASEARIGKHTNEHIFILGFHPYKEIVFLSEYSNTGFAYHLDQSKLEDLGSMRPKDFDYHYYNHDIGQSFPYTPCWLGQFLDNK